MKKLFLLLLIPFYCFAQNNSYTVDYELIRTKEPFVFNADGTLYIDLKNNVSNFTLSQYKNLLKDGEEKHDSESGETLTVLGSNRICFDNREYYHDFKKDSSYTILYNLYCQNKVLIKDSINYPKWEIKNEFKKIGEYNAQKAIAFIYDRTWTVYFTNELPINGGPWRLIGLPGLVLEATENTSTYEFRLLKIEKQKEYAEIARPYHKNESTFDEFVKKSVKRQTDEMYFRLSNMGDDTYGVDKSNFPLYETVDFIEKRE